MYFGSYNVASAERTATNGNGYVLLSLGQCVDYIGFLIARAWLDWLRVNER